MSKFKDSVVPKANPYLLRELELKYHKLEQAERKFALVKELSSKSLEERQEIAKQLEKLKTENSELTVEEKEEKDREEAVENDTGPFSIAKKFVLGVDPDFYDEYVETAIEATKRVAGSVSPVSFTYVDPCEDREEIDAGLELAARRYEAKELLTQLKKRLNPLQLIRSQLNINDQIDLGYLPGFRSTSAQEAISIMSTVHLFAKKIANKENDQELKDKLGHFSSLIGIGSSLDRESFLSIGLSDEVLTDKQLAKKLGLKNLHTYVDDLDLVQGRLPQMFFEVQGMLSSYNVLQNISGSEKIVEALFEEIELKIEFDEDVKTEDKEGKITQEKKQKLESLIKEKITGESGIKRYIDKNTYGGAILNPLVLGGQKERTLEEFTVFRLLVEKNKRQVQSNGAENGHEKEISHRLVDAYQDATSKGLVADDIERISGKGVDQLLDSELDNLIDSYKTKDIYFEMEDLFLEIKSSLPAFAELRAAVKDFKSDMSYDEFKIEIQKSKQEVERIIKETLGLDAEKSIDLASAFVAANEGYLSEKAKQIPETVKQILRKLDEH